ncbi:MAG TPA: hypothetical protein VD948_11835 [Rhodothermales bacterium]|nr:hypothetical protein [Rhodothermales bacterium]
MPYRSAFVLMALLAGSAAAQPARFTPAALDRPERSVVVRQERTGPPDGPAWPPAPPDQWIAYDKAQHVLASALLVLSAQYALETKGGASRHAALPLSIGVSAGAGFAKESFDLRRVNGTGFSKKDLVADAVGIAAAVAFILW